MARSALADNVPHAHLYLSPLHALFIDGVLIQVAPLVNGTSIIPAASEGMKDIEYFQIELATHEVILAEGAPVETYLNTNGREHFTNFVEYERLYGRETGPTVPYAPVYGYSNARAHLKALLRLGISHVVDVRDPIQRTYDRIAARGRISPFRYSPKPKAHRFQWRLILCLCQGQRTYVCRPVTRIAAKAGACRGLEKSSLTYFTVAQARPKRACQVLEEQGPNDSQKNHREASRTC